MECGENGRNGVGAVCHVAMAQEQEIGSVLHQGMVEKIVKDHQAKLRVAMNILVLVSFTFV